jgi:hypothetical protein
LDKKDFIILHGKVAAFILSKEGQKLIKEGNKEIINLSNRIFKKETLELENFNNLLEPLTKKF